MVTEAHAEMERALSPSASQEAETEVQTQA